LQYLCCKKTSPMKKLTLLLCCCFLWVAAICQISQIKIINLQVKNVLPAKTDDWRAVPAALILTAQKPPGIEVKEPGMVLQIKSNGAFICGNTVSTAIAISPFEIKTFSSVELTGMLGNCSQLKEGSYQICVQFFNADRIAISNEVCKEFRVESAKANSYTAPALISPENGKVFSADNMKRPLNFRWTPVVPKPQTIIYRLKVWQLMQGQSGSQAMRSNPPIVTKDCDNITQAVISGIYTGPCRPPYLCDFVWQVQAVDKEGRPMGGNNGLSEAFSFSVSNNASGEVIDTPPTCATPVINFPENGKAFNKDTKNIEIKGLLNGEGKNVKLLLFKIDNDPNLVDDLRQKSKAVSIFSPLEMFDYSGTAKNINSSPKNYDVEIERSANNSAGFSATVPTAELEHGSYYVIIQNGNCSSTPLAFSMSAGCGTNLSTVNINCKGWVNGFPTYTVSIVFNNIPPLPGGQNCTTVMNSILAVTGGISGLATLPVTIPSGGSAPAVTFTYTPATATQTSVNFNYFGIWNDGFSNTSNFGSGAITLPSCVCTSCKDIQWNTGLQTATVAGTNFNIVQPLNIAAAGLGNIVGAKAEIIAFERYVGDSCVGCNKDYILWGNFTSGTYAGNNGSFANATAPVSGNTTHSLYWNASGGGSFPANSPFNLNITTPVLSNLTCCCDRVAVTIRYTFTFKNGNNSVCKMCSFIKRYEYKKGNCRNVVIDTPGDVNVNPSK
jgi:hypothetical protein